MKLDFGYDLHAMNSTPLLRFLHVICNEIAPMREFYTNGLGLNENSYRDDEEGGWLSYPSENLQIIIHRWSGATPVPVAAGWAWQPGDEAGDVPALSFALQVDYDDYADLVDRLERIEAHAMTDVPTWRQNSYWGWTVKDPMGNTIELFTAPSSRPDGDPPTWPPSVTS